MVVSTERFPLRESASIMSGNSKAGSQLRNYLEVHSLNSDQVPFKRSVDGLLHFFLFAFELQFSLFHMFMIKRAIQLTELFNFSNLSQLVLIIRI